MTWPSSSAIVQIDPVNFGRTFSMQNIGAYDPTISMSAGRLVKAFDSGNGPCVVEVLASPGGVAIKVSGEDCEDVLAQVICGFSRDDGYASFSPDHSLVLKMHDRFPGLRLLGVPWSFDIICGTILQQRIRFVEAARQWRAIAIKYGEKSPEGLSVFPPARIVAGMESWRFEELGVDGKRSRAMITVAREFKRRTIRPDTSPDYIRTMLGRLPGIGPWTTEYFLGYALGDPDALPLADLFLPHVVTYAFTGEERGSDERMVELLEPFRGQRFRIIRLLGEARVGPPRNYSPRPATLPR